MFITPESNILLVYNSTLMEMRLVRKLSTVILGLNHAANPCTTEVLQNDLTCIIASITKAELQKVSQNLFR
jgi:hypothetical protein